MSTVQWLFLDLNSYFASVEQERNPRLRGKPIAVGPANVPTGTCIAASIEAKKFGVKTGTLVRDARRLCPQIEFIESDHEVYIEYHHAIIEAVESCIPVTSVMSIDEMACKLMGSEMQIERATEIALKIKQTIKDKVGSTLLCSIGLAPNRFLAKTASDMQKPDGLVVITKEDLPHILHKLKPMDLCGIGRRMNERLEKQGITTMKQLTDLDIHGMRKVWGGINGEYFWHWIQGHEIPERVTKKRTVGHSHILPPELRNERDAYNILQKLVHKVGIRLRKYKYWAAGFHIFVSEIHGEGWGMSTRLVECQDTLTLLEALASLWAKRPERLRPYGVGVNVYDIVPDQQHTLSLFGEVKRTNLSGAMDKLNQKFGKNTIYFGGIHDTKTSAPTRIAFTSIPDVFE